MNARLQAPAAPTVGFPSLVHSIFHQVSRHCAAAPQSTLDGCCFQPGIGGFRSPRRRCSVLKTPRKYDVRCWWRSTLGQTRRWRWRSMTTISWRLKWKTVSRTHRPTTTTAKRTTRRSLTCLSRCSRRKLSICSTRTPCRENGAYSSLLHHILFFGCLRDRIML